jgi:teichuronic acid biosynthesis glycosyltransferase TuaG
MPLVSIITPTFNSAPSLRTAIDSVRAQTFQDWELVIVDDASYDGTTALISRYAAEDERIRLIRRAEKGGVSVARNHGVTASTGRFIAFLDADDSWAPTKLDHQLKFMEEHKATLSATGFRRFSTLDSPRRLQTAPLRVTFDHLVGKNIVSLSTMMIDRDTSGPLSFDTDFTAGEDIALLLLMTKSGHDIYFMAEDLARIHDSRNYFHRSHGIWRAYRHTAGLPKGDALKAILQHGARAIFNRMF